MKSDQSNLTENTRLPTSGPEPQIAPDRCPRGVGVPYCDDDSCPGLKCGLSQKNPPVAPPVAPEGKDGWISVKQELPPRDKHFLWALKGLPFAGQVQEGWYDPWPNGMQFWRSSRTPSVPNSLREVSHWRPLPDPPESEAPMPNSPEVLKPIPCNHILYTGHTRNPAILLCETCDARSVDGGITWMPFAEYRDKHCTPTATEKPEVGDWQFYKEVREYEARKVIDPAYDPDCRPAFRNGHNGIDFESNDSTGQVPIFALCVGHSEVEAGDWIVCWRGQRTQHQWVEHHADKRLVPAPPTPPVAEPEKCGACVITFIAREGLFFPCARPKGHDGGHRASGNCFKHGVYLGMEGQVPQCPKWPDCANPAEPPVETGEQDKFDAIEISFLNDSIAALQSQLRTVQEKSDAEMERVKACEHIAEGDEGWESLANICPSTAAVAALRIRLQQAVKILNESMSTRNLMAKNNCEREAIALLSVTPKETGK